MKQSLALLAVCIVTAACASAAPQRGQTLFHDDFSSAASGWNRHADADAITDYLDGEYQIKIDSPNLNVWAVAGPKLTDAALTVDAHTDGGTDNNLFGLICRYQNDNNFYFLAISADGYYTIAKLKEGKIVHLSGPDFQHSDSIQPGHATHRLSAACAGSTLTLSDNGTQLATTTDSDFRDGLAGLIAGSFDDTPVDVRFDNLNIVQP